MDMMNEPSLLQSHHLDERLVFPAPALGCGGSFFAVLNTSRACINRPRIEVRFAIN